MVVPDTYSALGIVARSDMAALIPRRLAMLSAQRGFIQLVEPPYPAPPIELSCLPCATASPTPPSPGCTTCSAK
uniref:Uncharacterized protein n=1 Tax=Phenylobacterium glaciei TaxID=2803784 RepID=A0A974P410_9CAUL|nr:hypothetical protein JKL49_25255 [Phenylobacterium glaciei]